MKASEIRKRFLEYFEKRGHTIVPSSTLIPEGDPTLLFTNAGMVQFKKTFLDQEKRDYTKAASCQKCMRAGGKHNDLENVGKTARHHTFFEMLGNFSFGDYFKEDAIRLAWDFLTKEIKIDPAKLYATVFEKDDEAAMIWAGKIGMPKDRVVRMGKEDNFWSMGDTGPCGPCSEILIDQGAEIGCKREECRVGCDCDRFLELWNLVFMEYERDETGTLTPLPRPCIDTGMGLERLSAVAQGKTTSYECDLFIPIMEALEGLSGAKPGQDPRSDISIKAIADHSRAVTFLISEGILPGNEGRNYVLRRIIRRASRHGKVLGLNEPFLYKLIDTVIETLADTYPEIKQSRDITVQATKSEEERFLETLSTGIVLLENEISRLKGKRFPAETAFKLYDTYGFPLDLTNDILREYGLTVDQDGFDVAMEAQKRRARMARKPEKEEKLNIYKEILRSGVRCSFVGYETDRHTSEIVRIIKGDRTVEDAKEGEVVEIVTLETPFYGESGGQAGDKGVMLAEGVAIDVTDTKRPLQDMVVHLCTIRKGKITAGDTVVLIPDSALRRATCLNHTATHLLNATLRNILGKHIKQSGSLVMPGKLRFDFYHFSPLYRDTIKEIEHSLNEEIRRDLQVTTSVLPYQEAIQRGALAFFDDKYGETVRMVEIEGLSRELCGGTHVTRTGEIGLFKIVQESSVAAGIRRIEAVTGEEAVRHIQVEEDELKRCASILKTAPKDIAKKALKLLQEHKIAQGEAARLKEKLKEREVADMLGKVKAVAGLNVLSALVDAGDINDLRLTADKLKSKLGSGIVVLGCRQAQKTLLLTAVTKDLTDRLHAGRIVKELAGLIEGKGGGRAEMAQAGGDKPELLPQAIERVYKIIGDILCKQEEV